MKIFIFIVKTLILCGCGVLMSCANDREGACNPYTFSGVLIIDKVEIKEYHDENFKIIYGTFNADSADAPQELKPAKVEKKMFGGDALANIKPGKFYLKTVTIYGGSCPPGPVFESPEKWQEIRE